MKLMTVASVSVLLLLPGAAHAQHSLGMHSHSGTGTDSACAEGRWNGPIELYPLAQAGSLSHKVSATGPKAQEAQQYFNQGLTFFYGFDAESSLRSFHQAAVKDPGLAMAHWGIALAAGGDLNIPIDDPCMKLAIAESEIANGLAKTATRPERIYIDALAQRYATGPATGSGSCADVPIRDPQQLGVCYMQAMKSLHRELGAEDPDAGSLYAYSLMNLRPWLWWTTSGTASAEITEALDVIAAGLSRFPSHIGLNHMQIHAREEAPVAQADRALPSAKLLFEQAPFITPHLRHMPAHTFLLLGDWAKVVAANQNAKAADQPWAKACQGQPPFTAACNQLLVGHYYSHDLLFLDVGYNNQGKWEDVEPLSEEVESNVRRFMATQPGLEHYLTTNVAMRVHFGKWKQLTELPPPQSPMPKLFPKSESYCADLKYKLASAMWYFGRAMGQASLRQPTDESLNGFQQAQACVDNSGLGWGNNSAAAILRVVHWRLLERIARMKGLKEASRTFALLAVETEDLLDYDEPPGWYLSSRETYGSALYLNGQFNEAIAVFREDLRRRPNNSRSLFGIWQSLVALQSPDAAKAKADFDGQWKSGVQPTMQDL